MAALWSFVFECAVAVSSCPNLRRNPLLAQRPFAGGVFHKLRSAPVLGRSNIQTFCGIFSTNKLEIQMWPIGASPFIANFERGFPRGARK